MQVGVFLSTLAAVGIGFATGAVTATLVAPELFGRQEARIPEAVTARLVATGEFGPTGDLFAARGRVQILEGGDITLLRFTDFAVSNGPHQEVWLIEDDTVSRTSDVRADSVLSLGPLKRGIGDQVYLIPDGVDIDRYPTVAIWGAEFPTLYATAALDG